MYKDKNKIMARSFIIFFLSNAGKKVGKITIQSGFSLEGTVNVFGYTLEAVIKVSPTEVHVKVEMSPIELGGGAIALRKSEKDTKKGAVVEVKIGMTTVSVKINAYVSFLGLGIGAVIDVSEKGFEFTVEGKLMDLIKAKVTVTAGYGSLKDASFKVKMCIVMAKLLDYVNLLSL